jgi:hypothetical protein
MYVSSLRDTSMSHSGSDKIFKSSVLMRRIKKFEEAAIELSWKGSRHPDDHKDIEKEYNRARKALISYVLEYIL